MRPLQTHLLINRRQRRLTRRARSLRRRGQRLGLGIFALVMLAGLGLLAAAGAWYSSLTADLPAISQVQELLDPAGGLFLQPTRVYDRSGQHLLYTLENPGIPRRYLKSDPAEPDHFSPELVRVTIALLDPGFWQHPGFSWRALSRPQPETIAERLALEVLLAQEPATPRRALRMRILAAQLVSRYGRPQVLEWYLNSASFGHLAYGAESAARLYLDKSAGELSLADAALLVPLADAPALNPLDAPAAALERRDAALDALREAGAISAAEHQSAAASRPLLRPAGAAGVSLAPAFTSLAIDQAAADLGRGRLERGGLRLITTLDYDLQLQTGCAAASQLERLAGRTSALVELPDGSPCEAARLLPTLSGEGRPGLAASVVLLDPRSGQVLALSGDAAGTAVGESLRSHPAGSLLAPFSAVAAFARGYGPASLVWDIPPATEAEEAARLNIQAYRGPLRLRLAIANDVLRPQVELIERLGGAYIWRLAASLGLSELSEERSAEALYAGPRVSPLEIAGAYALFAAQGNANGRRSSSAAAPAPNLLLYIEDARGTLLLNTAAVESQPLLSPALAYLVHDILADEPARWSSLGFPNALEIGRPAGAKLGRVQDGSQTWAVGYTPQRLAVVWLGRADAQPAPSAAAVDPLPVAGIWHALLQYASRGLPAEDWSAPAGLSRVSVCDPSGELPTGACPAVVEEVFLSGNEPVSSDTLYQVVQVNRETGRLATVFTAPALIEERVVMAVPPEARLWAEASNQPLAPEIYDVIQPPAPSADANLSAPALFAYVSGKVTLRGSAGGNDFVSYRLQAGEGLNPQTWLQIGEESRRRVANGELGRWDTTGLDGLYALRLVVVRGDSRVETATIQVTVDNTPPLARVTYPLNGQPFELPADRNITFLADVSDEVGLARVEWLLDGKTIGQNLVPPYSLTWSASAGEHRLSLRALDLAGNSSESAPVPFQVAP